MLKVIDNAERKAFEDTAYGVIEALKLAYTEDVANEVKTLEKTYQFPNGDLKLSGEKPKGGTASINENGKISIAIYDKKKKYCAIKNTNEEKVTVKDFKGSTCDNNSAPSDPNKTITKADPPINKENKPNVDTYKAILYLDPTDLSKTCTEGEVVSTTGTKTGCMKWYVYDDSSDNYKAILDHNTTAKVAWNESGNADEGPVTLNNQLKSDVTGWDNSLNAGIITANEIAIIVDNKTFETNPSVFTFFKDRGHYQREKYYFPWLYDYIWNCKSIEHAACNAEDADVSGYWTSTPAESDSAWFVIPNWLHYGDGHLRVNSDYYGIRPVITVSKAIVK